MAAQPHFTTPAETIIMEAIDQVINNLPNNQQVLIDYDFLRSYTIYRLQNHYFRSGVRAYVYKACASVYVTRSYYQRKKIAFLHFS